MFVTPLYESTTEIYVLSRASTETVTSSDLTASTALTSDYQQIITSRDVLEKVIEELGLDMTYDQLYSNLSVSILSDTRILSITVSDPDPLQAQELVTSIREVSAEHIQTIMDIQAVNTVEEANLAENPSSPNVTKNTLIGAILGIFLVAGLIVLLFILDDRIKTPDDIEKHLGISVLGSIPLVESFDKGKSSKNNKKATKKPVQTSKGQAPNTRSSHDTGKRGR